MHTSSYWHATLDRPALSAADLPPAAEVVVVGAGVHGAAAAYWLARAGARPVLLDRHGPAAGATGHNGGLCVTGTAEVYPDAIARLGHADARAIWALSAEGLALLQQIVAEEAIACDLRPGGTLNLALGEPSLAGYRRSIAALAADGFRQELVDRAGAEELMGLPLGPEVVGGKYNPHAATLHSARLVHGLLAAAARHGARLVWGAEVASIAAGPAGVQIATGAGAISAGAAVVAVNAWSGGLLPFLRDLITPVRGQALATAPVPAALRCGFGAALTPTGEYGQQAADGSVIFGGCRAAAPDRDVGLISLEPGPAVQDALDAALSRLFPTLAAAPVAHRWGGPMAFTPDYTPIAGAAPGLPGVWFAGGFSGHGMPFAPVFGRLLAEAATSGVAPAALAPFRLDRPSLRPAP
jgi:glycine/D-amino acid oxidase-like deaminating enzyme